MNEKKKKKSFVAIDKKTLVIILLILFVFAVAMIVVSKFKEKDYTTADFSGIDKICELATLRCYYHDVVAIEEDPKGLFKYGLFQYGYKRFWMEYDGIVEIGIDIGDVHVEEPDKDGVVRVYVPEAKILNVDVDEDSMKDPIVDKGVLTTVTSQEKANAFSEAQKEMKEGSQTDKSILSQAHNNAKELIKQYIVNVGEQIGQDYRVKWIEKPRLEETEKGE